MTPSSVSTTLILAAALAAPVARAEPTPAPEAVPAHASDLQLSVTFMQLESFSAAFEGWSKHLGGSGYWRSARVGGGINVHSAYEADEDDRRRHVDAIDYAVGYAMDTERPGWVRFRSVFLAGYATMDQHAKDGIPGQEREPTSFGYFDTRQGVNLIPPTHEASGTTGDSLLELGVGFRWNFIGADRNLRAGDVPVREMQVYPYLAANMYL